MDLDEDPFEIKCPSDQKLIEFVDLEVFETAIERALAGKFLYKWSMGNLFFYRGFLWQGMLHSFCIPNDFLTIKEYKYAAACGFEDYSYSDWKDITQLGYKTEKEFKTASGSYDAKEWKRIKLLGFNTHKKFDEATDMGFTGFMVDKKICMSFQTMEKKYNAAEKDYNFYDCFDYSIKALYHRLPGIKKENLSEDEFLEIFGEREKERKEGFKDKTKRRIILKNLFLKLVDCADIRSYQKVKKERVRK